MEIRAAFSRRRAGLSLAATAAALALVTTGAANDPALADPGSNSSKVERLTKQIKALEKQYGGDLAQLRNAQFAANQAVERAKDLKTDLNNARGLVAQLAASQYMSGGVEPEVAVLTTSDPADMLGGAAMASHISENQATKVKQIQTLVSKQEEARKAAEQKIAKLAADIKATAKERDRVKQLLKKFKPESPSIGMGGVTPRMNKVKQLIDDEFGPFIVIGCTRPGDPQDHGTGRACDFMESSGGSMPTAARSANGDAVSAWAVSHASSLGIKYVIWKQRIYDMRRPGWRAMENRGGITANHFDHVHISVF